MVSCSKPDRLECGCYYFRNTMKEIPGNTKSRLATRNHRWRYRNAHRLHGRKAYAAVFEGGKRFFAAGLVVVVRANQLPYMRFGLSIGKRHGKAVARNRLKKILRESFRTVPHRGLGGLDLVVVVRRAEAVEDVTVVNQRLNRLLKAAYHKLAVEPEGQP